MMSKEKWYGSAEHFRTEKSYDEYKKGLYKKNSCQNLGWFAKKLPKIKF